MQQAGGGRAEGKGDDEVEGGRDDNVDSHLMLTLSILVTDHEHFAFDIISQFSVCSTHSEFLFIIVGSLK